MEAMTRSQAIAGRYPDAGEDAVRDAIARLHGLAPERVALGCGSTEVLRMAAQAFLGTGKTVVAAEPTFEAVLRFARVTQAEAVTVPLSADFRHDLVAMAKAVDARTGLVYVCNPNNPTGTVVSGEELDGLLAHVPPSVIVLVDEAYHHFVESPRYRSACDSLGRSPNLVVARTFSKIYGMAGMRLGYAVGSEANVAAMVRHSFWSNVNVAALEAALASLEDPDLVPRQRRLINDTRRWLCSELTRQGRRFIPSETNFVMIDVGTDVGPVIAAFKERRILVGRRFPSLPNWLRVSIGTRPEMEAFLAALGQVVPALA
jgi:histidinol-phosphate aminotransferase